MNTSASPTTFTSRISEEINIIEHRFKIKILFVVESEFLNKGSNSGCNHEIEFIYVDRQELPAVENYRWIDFLSEDKERYYQGNELRNFLYSIAATSPHTSECLMADTIHYTVEGFKESILPIHDKYFNPIAAIHDIWKQADMDYWDHIEDNHYLTSLQFTQCHKWFLCKFKYFLRPLLVCKYIEKWRRYPAVNFKELVDITIDEPSVKERIYRFIDLISKTSRRKHPFLAEDNLEDYARGLLAELCSKYADFKKSKVPQCLGYIEDVYSIFK